MPIAPSDVYRAATVPFTADGGTRLFNLDTSADSTTLAAGTYEILNAGSDLAWVRCGAAVTAPVDKGDEVTGMYPIPAGASLALALAASTVLHGVADESETMLLILRKVAL